MKKIIEKSGILGCVGMGLTLVSIILYIVTGAAIKAENTAMIMNIVAAALLVIGIFLALLKSNRQNGALRVISWAAMLLSIGLILITGYIVDNAFVFNLLGIIGVCLFGVGFALRFLDSFKKKGVINLIGALLIVLSAVLALVMLFVEGETLIHTLTIISVIAASLGLLLVLGKTIKEAGALKGLGIILIVIGIILSLVTILVTNEAAVLTIKIIALCATLIGGMIVALKSEDHRLAKSLLVFIAVAVLATWLLPYGYFQSTDFVEYDFQRVGIMDFGYTIYYAINFMMDKIVFLILLTGFYGILSVTDSYKKLVSKTADVLSHKNMFIVVLLSLVASTFIALLINYFIALFVTNVVLVNIITAVIGVILAIILIIVFKKVQPVITSALLISVGLFVATSLFSQTFVVLLFVPFFISVLLKMNLDKLTVFAITIGSLLAGILGATFGTDSLIAFNYYTSQEITLGLTNRLIVALVALVLYNFFLVIHIKKVLNETKKSTHNSELEDDPFMVEETKSKVSVTSTIVTLVIVAVIAILGYISWESNWNFTVFNELHSGITGLSINDEVPLINYIEGINNSALGAYSYVFTMGFVLLLASVVVAIVNKLSAKEYVDGFCKGLKTMVRPFIYLVGVYALFGLMYMSPIIPTITNWLLNLVEGFNPFLTTLSAIVVNAFHNDFGYTAYTIGGFLTSAYAQDLSIVHTIFTSMYGLVQMILPTSAILVVGLGLMKIDYKEWFKYIWLFVVGMLVILLVLFTVLTYA